MQKITIAYNFSLAMLEFNALSNHFKAENNFFILELKKLKDKKGKAKKNLKSK